MSATQVDPALAFLTEACPLGSAKSRRQIEVVRLQFRSTEILLILLVQIALCSMVPRKECARPGLECFDLTSEIVLQCAAIDLAVVLGLLCLIQLSYWAFISRLRADKRLGKNVAVIGTAVGVSQALAALKPCNADLVCAITSYTYEDDATGPLACRGHLQTLLCDARLRLVDVIVIADKPETSTHPLDLRTMLKACVQDIYVQAGDNDNQPSVGSSIFAGSGYVLVQAAPIRGRDALCKRAFDLVASFALLAFMAPLFGLIAIAIKVETRGPVLFRQLRVGKNNRLFHIQKFRSMVHDQADRLAKQQTRRDDPRVTRVGRFLRKLSLDELPQLFNVVIGDMSLVGPRPHAPGTSINGQRVHRMMDDYACRHLVAPGITGLAQVRGYRGGLHDQRQLSDRIASDLEYIHRWSFWLDIRILLGTVVLEMRDSRGS